MATISRQTAVKVIYWNAAAAVIVLGLLATTVVRRLHAYDTLIVEVGRNYGVDPRLISSLIWRESHFDPTVVGEHGEVGLMQVTEAAGHEWADAEAVTLFTKRDLYKPRDNVRAGTWYLRQAIDRWSDRPDPLPYALAEYNAGRSNALRWADAAAANGQTFIDAITFPVTREYVRSILTRYRGRV